MFDLHESISTKLVTDQHHVCHRLLFRSLYNIKNNLGKLYKRIEQTIETYRFYKIVAMKRAIFSVCLKEKEREFTGNEEDMVHLPLKTGHSKGN